MMQNAPKCDWFKITDVPEEDLEKIVRSFRSDGAIAVSEEKQPDGKYNVSAEIPAKY